MAFVLTVGGTSLWVFVLRPDPPPITHAIQIIEDDSRYSTSLESGQSFLRVSDLLLKFANQCQRDSERRIRCAAAFQGAAYSRTLAVRVLECTRPGIFEARQRTRSYLRSLEQFEDGRTARSPLTPRQPVCVT